MKIIRSAQAMKLAEEEEEDSRTEDERFEDCVLDLKEEQGCSGDDCEYNPWAVCNHSVKGL